MKNVFDDSSGKLIVLKISGIKDRQIGTFQTEIKREKEKKGRGKERKTRKRRKIIEIVEHFLEFQKKKKENRKEKF